MASDSGLVKSSNYHKIQIGFNLSPSMAFRTLKVVDETKDNRRYYDDRQKSERPAFGHSVGLTVLYNLNEHLALQTWVNYSVRGFAIHYNTYQSTGSSYYYVRSNDIMEYHFVEVPIALRISAGKNRIRFTSSAGIGANILFANSWVDIVHDEINGFAGGGHLHAPADKSLKVFTLSAQASVGLDYIINDHQSVRLEPFFSHQFLPLEKAGVSTYLWNAGISCIYCFSIIKS